MCPACPTMNALCRLMGTFRAKYQLPGDQCPAGSWPLFMPPPCTSYPRLRPTGCTSPHFPNCQALPSLSRRAERSPKAGHTTAFARLTLAPVLPLAIPPLPLPQDGGQLNPGSSHKSSRRPWSSGVYLLGTHSCILPHWPLLCALTHAPPPRHAW